MLTKNNSMPAQASITAVLAILPALSVAALITQIGYSAWLNQSQTQLQIAADYAARQSAVVNTRLMLALQNERQTPTRAIESPLVSTLRILRSGGQLNTEDGTTITLAEARDERLVKALIAQEAAAKNFATLAATSTPQDHQQLLKAADALQTEIAATCDAFSALLQSNAAANSNSYFALSFLLMATVLVISAMVIRHATSQQRKTAAKLHEMSDLITHRIVRYSEDLAAATQQTSQSIDEIACSSSVAVSSLGTALESAESSCEMVQSLGQYTEAVARLISEITSISEQTNLLALNATIESARAGDAGKGFSVVANEVKQLANVTHTTADHVITQVKGIQNSSDATVRSTRQVLDLIRKSYDSQGTIVSAVDEQRTIVSQLAQQATALASEARSLSSDQSSLGRPGGVPGSHGNASPNTSSQPGDGANRKPKMKSFSVPTMAR